VRLALRTAALIAIAGGIPAGVAAADSFTPVGLDIGVAPVARLHQPLAVTVHVTADPGMLDDRTAPLRIQVKLARQCGGDFQYTTGAVLLDKRLSPQPTTGRAYSALERGSGRPAGYGTEMICTYLEEEGDDRVFANDESVTTDVSKACTAAATRYDHLRRARDARRHRARIDAARRGARHACGPGVLL
jgi:hypothetical protein